MPDGYGQDPIITSMGVSSYRVFAATIQKPRNGLDTRTVELGEFTSSAYYLLGWFLGDLGKHYRDESKRIMDIDIQLTRKHHRDLGSRRVRGSLHKGFWDWLQKKARQALE